VRSIVSILALALAGAIQPAPQQSVDTAHLTAVPSAAAAGNGRALLHLDVSPKPKMHVYAPGEKDAIPVSLTLDASPGVKPGKISFPPPQKYFFAPLKLTQLVYSKPFRLTLPITIASAPATKALTVSGTLEYQACDDSVCYIPKKVRVSWKL
jgi:DsbC/DsbD-like thiol-disulfide interchange protein